MVIHTSRFQNILSSPQHARITAQNRPEFVSALLARGADVDAADDNGWTALHIACHQQFGASVAALVAAGANVNLKNSAGDAACQLACVVSEGGLGMQYTGTCLARRNILFGSQIVPGENAKMT